MNSRKSGFSCVEIVVSMAVMVVGFLGLVAGFHGSSRLAAESLETARLTLACNNVLEEIRAVPFIEVVDEFGSASGKDQVWCRPDGAITFSDPGDAVASGQIDLFTDESAVPGEFGDLSPGFDLNADGAVTSGEVADYTLLPLRLTLTAARPDGVRTMVVNYILSRSKFVW